MEIPLTKIPISPSLFPYRIKKKSEDDKFSKFLEMLKVVISDCSIDLGVSTKGTICEIHEISITKNRTVS